MAQDKPQHRFLKLFAVVIGAGLAGLAAATLALRLLLPPDKLKSLIAQEAGKVLGRQVRIKDVSVSLIQGLRVEGVEISEKPDFKAGTFVSVSSFDFKVQLMPLLSKRVVIDRMVMAGPSARIVKNKDGTFNFSDLVSQAPSGERRTSGAFGDGGPLPPASPDGGGAQRGGTGSSKSKAAPSKAAAAGKAAPASSMDLPFVLDVQKARVSGGSIVYADPAGAIEVSISGLDASADGFSLERAFPASFSLALSGRSGPMRLGGKASGEARFDLSRMKDAAPGSLPIGVSNLKSEVSMSVQDPSSELDAKLTDLSVSIGEARLDAPFDGGASLAFDAKSGNRRVQGKAAVKARFDLSKISEGAASADIKSVSLEAAGLKADLAMKFFFDPKQVSLAGIEGTMLGGKLTGLLKVRNYATTPDIKLEADLSSVELEKLLAANEATLVAPPGSKAGAKRSGAKPEASGATPEASGAKPGASEPKPKAAPSSSPPMSTSGSIKIGEARHQFASAKDISLEWDLKGITPSLESLGGFATMKIAGGHFSALDSLAGRSKVLKVLTLPFVVLQKIGRVPILNKVLPEFNTVTFTEITGDYVFERGGMTLRRCAMRSSAANVDATGTANLPAETLAVTVMSQVGRLAPIGIDVTGTFDQPKTRLKAETLLNQPVGKAIEPARKLIEGLFKRKK
ncbi:MAG: AsmA family protein [Elusimicrobia bacterium]|nr:AsmA family protein [Elusimicrobiota bacterium]